MHAVHMRTTGVCSIHTSGYCRDSFGFFFTFDPNERGTEEVMQDSGVQQ